MHMMLLRDARCVGKSEEFHRDTAMDASLLYDRPTRRIKQAVDWMNSTFLVE